MDLNVWTVTAVTSTVIVSHGTMFFWKLFNVNASIAGDMGDFMKSHMSPAILALT